MFNPEIKVVAFAIEDVITTSTVVDDTCPNKLPDGEDM